MADDAATRKRMPNTRLMLLLCACGDELEQYKSQGPRYEARAWLAVSTNPYPFASNRFTLSVLLVELIEDPQL
jgi:hypothetical protein